MASRYSGLKNKILAQSDIVENNRRSLLIFSILVAFLIPDTMINYVSDLIVPYLISFWSITFFTVIVSVGVVGAHLTLEFVRRRTKDIRTKDTSLRIIHYVVIITQYTLLTIAVILLSQIFISREYPTILLTLTSAIVEILAVSILGFFALRFFSWFNLNRNSVIVLLYGLSFALLALSLAIISSTDLYLLPQKESRVDPQSEVLFPYDYIEAGSIIDRLLAAYPYFDMASFVLLVAGTALLLRHYARKIGKLKFWIFISLPLVYFLSATMEKLGFYNPASDTEWFYWWLYVSLNSTAGGMLFGVAFMTIAKTIREDSLVKQYMIIAAYGFILMFISNQVTLIGASYPPFGIATISFLPLAAYMAFLGVYSTAVSISQDSQLRKSIRKIATQDSNLLGSIGTAQMEREIRRTVNSMKDTVAEQEKELEEQTGIEANMEEDEMKNYLEQVMQEVGKVKKPETT